MKHAYYVYQGRLSLFHEKESPKEYWCGLWGKHGSDIDDMLQVYRKGYLGDFESVFSRYLRKDLPVLEAGCGLGQYVAGLQARGYQVEGVDFEENVVAKLNKVAPDLKIRKGDIYNLDSPDKKYGGYISIGIFEHNLAFLEKGLREVYRVLNPQGVALIAVPLLNDARGRMKAQVPIAEREKAGSDLYFYQAYFSSSEFKTLLQAANLEVAEAIPYGVYSGITRDFAWAKWLEQKKCFHWRLRSFIYRFLEKMPAKQRGKYAHMMMYVCKPLKSGGGHHRD